MKISKSHKTLLTTLLCVSLVPYCLGATEEKNYSPYVNGAPPRNLYWGDTHLHTRLSADAYGFGARLTPEDAYAIARGETVTSNTGQAVRLRRPLDFLVITDHAEYLGIASLMDSNPEALKDSEIGQRWLKFAGEQKNRIMNLPIVLDAQSVSTGELTIPTDNAILKSVWEQVTETADTHNDPGRFTAFIGYEWSSLPGGNNLHRNVIFRDDATKAKQVLPFSAIDSKNPEDLWRFLELYEEHTGGNIMAIPHNGNISNGLMFTDESYAGTPLTRDFAATRARWEPIIEVTQIKGDGESHPYLSPEDEFADFDIWDEGNFSRPKVPKEKDMLQYEYARSALRLGLRLGSQIGANPFKFGMIGSTDSHTALSAVEENNYFGKFAVDEPSPGRTHSEPMPASRYAAAGYAAVWATVNTREALFDAMQRREVYATTGPRIIVRFFAAWDFDELDASRPDFEAIGYLKGVPMGSSLNRAPAGKAPKFLVAAGKDPMGANLDRIQVIKGWLDNDGNTHERVYNVALSNNRGVTPDRSSVSALKSTVDIETATYTNTVGASTLSAVWTDPDFDGEQEAFYYARVLEIRTPRWSSYDSAFYGSPLPTNAAAEIQERAYTSPIWYTP